MEIRSRYDTSCRVMVSFDDTNSMAKQSFKDECDVNNILQRHRDVGLPLPDSDPRSFYSDFSAVEDYRHAIEMSRQAEQYFMTLPSAVRLMFNNDAGAFLAGLDSPDVEAKLKEVGYFLSKCSDGKVELSKVKYKGRDSVVKGAEKGDAQIKKTEKETKKAETLEK